MKKLREFLIRLVYPETCFSCQKVLCLEESCFCHPCHENFKRKLFDLSTCEIESKLSPIRYLWTISRYEDTNKEVIKAFKFDKRADLLAPFHESLENLYSAIKAEVHHQMFMAVPSSLSSKANRFYSCADEITHFLAKKFKIENRSDLIHKRIGVPSQRHLRKEERLANLYGAFKISHSEQIIGKNILVIDDILTTGTTVREIARILIKNGAETVDCLTLARTLERKTEKKF